MANWPTWVSASATGPWNNCSTGACSGPPVARKASKVWSDSKKRCCSSAQARGWVVVPALLPHGHAQRPVKEVAHVGQNLHGQASGAGKSGKVVGRAFQGAGGPVGNGGQRVAQQFAFLVHTGTIAQAAGHGIRRDKPLLCIN